MDMSIKQLVKDLLMKRDYDRLLDLCERDRRFWKELRFSLYYIDEKIRWAAIEAVSKLMQRWWQAGHEDKIREYIRNLFWSMTDESGGIGWSSPQTVTEIIMKIPELLEPYGSMMIAYSIDEPPLRKGGLWGIGRLGRRIAGALNFFKEKLLAAFQSEDAETLGLLAWAMGEAGFSQALPFLEELRMCEEPVRIYIDGVFYEKPLKQWVEEAIRKIEKAE